MKTVYSITYLDADTEIQGERWTGPFSTAKARAMEGLLTHLDRASATRVQIRDDIGRLVFERPRSEERAGGG